MSTPPESNRFAPPTAAVADVETGTGSLAGRGTRLIAIIVDGLILGAIFGLLAWLTPVNIFMPGDTGGLVMILLRNLVVGFIAYMLVNGYLLHTQGQTVGKMLFKIRVVRSDGSKATLLRLAGLRYLVNTMITLIPVAGGIYALVDALMIFRDSRKCLHDNIADTIVVKA